MRLLCPAKINLHLRVGPRRADGFHSLLSWFCTVALFDTLTLELALPRPTSANSECVSLVCDQADIPCDARNLVVKVGKAFAEDISRDIGGQIAPVHAVLNKRIPAGAGLGGGSADGARALVGLNALWNANWPANHLSEFAGRFGSDLPFFFHGPSSICTGRGEVVGPVPRPAPRFVLLMLPPIHMPTADVYRRFDALKLGRDEDLNVEPPWQGWARLNALDLLEKLVNDLELPAFSISPALAALRANAEKHLGRRVRMSGSGSSLFTLFDTADEANFAAARLLRDGVFDRVEAVELAPDFIDELTTKVRADA